MKRIVSLLLMLCLLVSTTAFAEGKTYGEAPSLKAEVEAGNLPPVEERLPLEPYVSTAKEIGIYGGVYRAGGFGPHPWSGGYRGPAYGGPDAHHA